jgi:hypothetical protein
VLSEQTAIFTLHNINILIFITEEESVYSEIRTESFKGLIYWIINLKGITISVVKPTRRYYDSLETDGSAYITLLVSCEL